MAVGIRAEGASGGSGPGATPGGGGQQSPMRFPFIRTGLLVVVGSVFASLMMFWTSAGVAAADIHNDSAMTRALESQGAMWDHFRDHFLFSGSIPGILFWVGCALVLVGGLRYAAGGGARPAPSHAPPPAQDISRAAMFKRGR